MKNLLTTTLVLSLAMLTTNSIVAAECGPRWRKPEWYVRACLDNDKVYSVAYSKDGKNLITKAYGGPFLRHIMTEWDPATLTPIKIKDVDNSDHEEYGVIFDEKGNHISYHNTVLKAAAEAIDASIPHGENVKNAVVAATFNSNGKQLVTITKNPRSVPTIWERIPQVEPAKPALESETTK